MDRISLAKHHTVNAAMGRSDKDKEGKGRGKNASPAASGAVAALGNLNTAAALETLLKTAQGVAAAPAQLPNEAQQLLLAGGFDPLQSLARNPALLSRLAKNALPRSAPVSSLLPPLPPEGLSPQGLMALQAQLGSAGASPAALLGAAGGALGGHSMHGGTDLAALQQLLAVQAAATTPKHSVASSIASSVTPDMQGWSLERLGMYRTLKILARERKTWNDSSHAYTSLGASSSFFPEQHVNLLNQLKQAVPESVAVLLADARRKEAKKTAKRLANRKSASSSRARKKALVQEMTELNARLKRQAQILALLPDLVITINVDGVITFCSAQVERVLHHKIDDIVGAQLADLLVPASKDKLNRLVARLVESEQLATLGVAAVNGTVGANESGNDTEQALGGVSNNESAGAAAGGENSSEIAVVSEPSFPLSVVKVKAKDGPSTEIDNSDNSASNPASKGPSSLTQESIPRSPTASSLGNSDDAKSAAKAKDGNKKGLPSSDTSNSSSLSTAAKKVQKANQNLEKNVRAHNKKMKKKGCPSYRDDVTGADVTANNASARLSSLQHRPESSSEEDSGYRESNDSREETSSSASDSSASNRKFISTNASFLRLH